MKRERKYKNDVNALEGDWSVGGRVTRNASVATNCPRVPQPRSFLPERLVSADHLGLAGVGRGRVPITQQSNTHLYFSFLFFSSEARMQRPTDDNRKWEDKRSFTYMSCCLDTRDYFVLSSFSKSRFVRDYQMRVVNSDNFGFIHRNSRKMQFQADLFIIKIGERLLIWCSVLIPLKSWKLLEI